MEEKRKRKNWILGIVIALVALALALLPVLLGSGQKEAPDNASFLSAPVTRGDIRSTISGGGTLAEETGIRITVPKGVEVTEYLVSNGEWVEKDQPVAAVDKVTVMRTIAVIQENLAHLDKEIMKLAAPKTTTVLVSPLAGRVKAIYVEKGDKVADVMAEHGALMVISLDGKMAVELETEAPVVVGESVSVTRPDGSVLPGRAELRQGKRLVVTVTDNGPAIGETVSVTASDGTDLGSGELYVHSAWNLTAATGNVNAIFAKPEQQLIVTSRLCSLENMDGNGKYDKLAAQRREYEDVMLKLFSLYEYGAVTAPQEGRVAGIDRDKVGLMRSGPVEYKLMLLSGENVDPEPPADPSHPPANIVVRPAAVGPVTYGSVTFLVQTDPMTLSSFSEAPEVNYESTESHIILDFSSVILFGPDPGNGKWTRVSPNLLTSGDRLYFVYDESGALLWIVRPKQPEPVIADMGEIAAGGGGGGQAKPFEMYEIKDTELLHVIPQNTMTVKVIIDELDILSVAEGQTADVTVDALPGRTYTGVVSEIDPKGVNQGGNTKYTVTIAIDRDPSMLSGMNATAILTVGVTEDVLTLPAAALTEKGSKTVAYTGYDEQSRTLLNPVEVTTGVSDGTTVEILSGLEEGTTVWYTYYESEALPVFLAGAPTSNT